MLLISEEQETGELVIVIGMGDDGHDPFTSHFPLRSATSGRKVDASK